MTPMPIGNIQEPPNAPIIRANMTLQEIEATKIEWSRRRKEWMNCKFMNELMIEMLLEGLDQGFKEDLEEDLVTWPHVRYLQVMNTLIARHGQITLPTLEKNQDKMKASNNTHQEYVHLHPEGSRICQMGQQTNQ